MKILIVTHYFYPHIGGIEIVAYNQAKELVKKGHQVTIVTSKINNEKNNEKIEGIKIIRVKAWNWLEIYLGVPYPILSLNFFTILKKEVKANEIVHVHGHVYMSSVISAFLAKKFSKPFFVTQHNTYIEYKNILLRLTETVADKIIGKYTLKFAKYIFTVSKETEKYVRLLFPKARNLSVIYNGIDTKLFKPASNKELFRTKFHLPNKFLCLTVRRITFKNGIDTLLEAALLLKNRNDIHFLLGGTGTDYNSVKGYIKKNDLKNVSMLGFIKDTNLQKYYSLADLFILPSKKGEGFPLSVIESFSSGVPVLATKSGGHIEAIFENKTGFLVSPNNPIRLKEKILYSFNHPTLLKNMAINCRIAAENNYSWEKHVDILLKIYGSYESL